MTKYKLVVIMANEDGTINLPDGAICIGEPKVSNYYDTRTDETIIRTFATIKAWVPV